MAIEIELKAHIRDSETTRNQLLGKAEYLGSFEKEDVYWSVKETTRSSIPKIRLRREKRRLPDGTAESFCLLTYKKKEVKDHIEINDEREFEIRPSSSLTLEEFEEFLDAIGLERGAHKRKQGWAFAQKESFAQLEPAQFELGRICAELVEVEGLGWFVELEILAENNIDADKHRDRIFAEGKKRLLDFLDSLGIEREAVESRFYTEMLAEK